MRHLQEELEEAPVHDFGDQQILRLANERRNAAQRRAHGAVHHQVAQERPELLEIVPVEFDDLSVGGRVVVVMVEVLPRSDLVIHTVETDGHGNDHGRHGQCIEKRGQHRCRKAEDQRQQHLRTNAQQNLRKREQQHLAQEVDTRNHEHEEQDDREVVLGLDEHMFRCRQPQDHCLDCEQATRLQWIALERHRERKDELDNEHPAGNERVDQDDERVDHEKRDDRRLVPGRRIAEKVRAH